MNKYIIFSVVGLAVILSAGTALAYQGDGVRSMMNKEFIDILVNKGPVPAFAIGVARFLHAIPYLNLSIELGQTFTALAVSAFALTSLDTATRLARFMFQEYFETGNTDAENTTSIFQNRFVATSITVAFGAALTFSGQTMSIWPVFGSANQLLAAIALLALTAWVSSMKKNSLFVLLPMLFMFSVTLTALGVLIYQNFVINNFVLSIISTLLFILSVILGIKAYRVLINGE